MVTIFPEDGDIKGAAESLTHSSKAGWSRWAGRSGVSRGTGLTISSSRSRISLGKKSPLNEYAAVNYKCD